MIKNKTKYHEQIAYELEVYLYESFYKPLWGILNDKSYFNSKSSLLNAIRQGRIYFEDNQFKGIFNISISRELSNYATFDKRSKTWKVDNIAKVPVDVKAAFNVANMKRERLENKIKSTLDTIESTIVEGPDPQLSLSIAPVINDMTGDYIEDFKNIGITPMITVEEKRNLIKDYNNNQELNIKNWNHEQIQRLREAIEEKVTTGYNKKELIDTIVREWEVSRNKAKFLARQETSLFVSKYRRERYKSAGVRKYVWSTAKDERVRDRHEHLDGKTFEFGNPPIVDDKGNRKEPGEDFNCRCIARPIIEEVALRA